ncbi:MAG: TonB-dependent receptor, partial [Gammaproteobacteria bacterium]
WKTQWFDHHLRWNGAIFQEDWKNFQFSFLGLNSVTIIRNAGNARIRGIENELEFAATANLTLSSAFTFLDPKLTQDYCNEPDPADPTQQAHSNPCPAGLGGATPYTPLAPAGANLPTSPKFKGNVIARYTLAPIADWEPNVQAAWVYQSQTRPALRTSDVAVIGQQPAYGLVDLSAGFEKNGMNIQFIIDNVADRRAELNRFVPCTVSVCTRPYIIPAQPRTIGIKFGQKF